MPEFKCEICGFTIKAKKPPLHCGQIMVDIKKKPPKTGGGN
jgi:hypothetical protein